MSGVWWPRLGVFRFRCFGGVPSWSSAFPGVSRNGASEPGTAEPQLGIPRAHLAVFIRGHNARPRGGFLRLGARRQDDKRNRRPFGFDK